MNKPAKTVPKPEKPIQWAIRLPASFLIRLDKLAENMSQPGMKLTRAQVLRLAAYRGVDLIEAELKKKP